MNEKQLKNKIEAGESQTLEFKNNMIPPPILKKIINAMINTKGGEIILGVKENGEIKGVDLNKNYIKINNDEIIIRGINNKNAEYMRYVTIKKYSIDTKIILLISVKKFFLFPIQNSDGNIYKRINDKTVLTTNIKNYYKSVEENKIIKNTIVPDLMKPGDEIVISDALILNPHNNKLKIKYRYDENDIKVFGPYQDEMNILNIEKNDQESRYHLKYCANKNIMRRCSKQLYIIVEEIVEKKWPYRLSRIMFLFLVLLSFIPLVKNIIDTIINDSFISLQLFNYISIPLPIMTIFSIILLSNRIDKILKRLSLIKIESEIKYHEKHIGGTTIIETY